VLRALIGWRTYCWVVKRDYCTALESELLRVDGSLGRTEGIPLVYDAFCMHKG
jgi:hypothetical protein